LFSFRKAAALLSSFTALVNLDSKVNPITRREISKITMNGTKRKTNAKIKETNEFEFAQE
jgi:hypothetical protein